MHAIMNYYFGCVSCMCINSLHVRKKKTALLIEKKKVLTQICESKHSKMFVHQQCTQLHACMYVCMYV